MAVPRMGVEESATSSIGLISRVKHHWSTADPPSRETAIPHLFGDLPGEILIRQLTIDFALTVNGRQRCWGNGTTYIIGIIPFLQDGGDRCQLSSSLRNFGIE